MDGFCDKKAEALRRDGTLHRQADRVADALFEESAFFDARDRLQVKYEMLRRVRVDGVSVTAASRAFGFSRVAFYQAWSAFEADGVAGLLPKAKGPQSASKLTDEVLAFLDGERSRDSSLRTSQLAELLRDRLGLSVHPRSIERALQRRPKKGRHTERP